jgi:predicted porin
MPATATTATTASSATIRATAAATPSTAAADTTTKIDGKLTYFGASYNLGVASLSVTNVSRKDETTASGVKTVNSDLSVNALGVSVPMGAITLNASMYQGENDLAGAASDTELSGHQLSARYALSKRTTVYALMGENKIKRDSGNTTGANRKETVNTIGLLHTF